MQYLALDYTYISCSCNRSPNILTWGSNGLIYYGSCNAVAVYDPEETQKVLHTCCEHKDEVRSVRWIKDCGGRSKPLLVSASSDATAVIWGISQEMGLTVLATLQGHSGPITTADGFQHRSEENTTEILIATSSVDMNVKIWKNFNSSYEFSCIQTLRAGSGFCLDVRLHVLPNTSFPILACAQDDFKIGLYVWEEKNFQKKESLIGHEDWVCCLDWITLENGDILLASGSQDTYIRLWRISFAENTKCHKTVSQLAPDEEIRPEQKEFRAGGRRFVYKLESVLLGHAAWVHSVVWHPGTKKSVQDIPASGYQPLQLLSTSMDASICIWEPDSTSGVWAPSARLGLIKEDSLALQGCVWGASGIDSIIAHTIQGSLHRWNKFEDIWRCGFTVGGGHFGEVLDLCWEPEGCYLLSVSSDQTARIHAPWIKYKSSDKNQIIWHELARPQVHGYDLTCVAPISRFRYVSGADEKIIRCFQASNHFKKCLKNICKVPVPPHEFQGSQSASVPVLGLSNVSKTDVELAEEALLLCGIEETTEPLREEVLWRGTLWPEERKLYGHGYEIYCVAVSHSGHVLASASKATKPEHAAIILWNTETWLEIQKLQSHHLTVTQMAFSPNDKFLLSVSRDRRLSVFINEDTTDVFNNESTTTTGAKFSLLFSTDKHNGIHTRIIWTCCWSANSKYFATGSREGVVVIWRNGSTIKEATQPLSLSQGVTALAFAACTDPYFLAVGTEDGSIFLYEWHPDQSAWLLRRKLDNQRAHHKAVKRLMFQPQSPECEKMTLASCSSDRSVKIFTFIPSMGDL